MNKILKLTLIVLSLWCLLLLIVAAVTQMQSFREWLRELLQREFRQATAGELIIDKIEGNLVTRFKLQGLRIEVEDDTLLTCQEVAVTLSPLKLLQRRVLIRELMLEAPEVIVRQRADSSWNYARLVEPSSVEKQGRQPNWEFDFLDIGIRDGRFRFHPLDSSWTMLGDEMREIQSDFSLSFETQGPKLKLGQLRFHAAAVPLPLGLRGGTVSFDNDTLRLAGMRLELGETHVMIDDGRVALDSLTYRAAVSATIPQLQEMAPLWPTLRAQGRLQFSGELAGNPNFLKMNLRGEYENGEFTVNGSVKDWDAEVDYALEAKVQRLNLADVFPGDSLDSRLNLAMALRGRGTTAQSISAELRLAIDSSRCAGYQLDQGTVNVAISNNELRGSLAARSSIGSLALRATVADLAAQRGYVLELSGKQLNMAAMTGNSNLRSDLTFIARARGQSFRPDTFDANGTLVMRPSAFRGVQIDTATAGFQLDPHTLQLDTAFIKTEVASITAAGSVSTITGHDLRWRAVLGNIELLRSQLALDTLNARGAITGVVGGVGDSLTVTGNYELESVQYNNLKVHQLTGGYDYVHTPRDTLTRFSARGKNLRVKLATADSASVTGVYRDRYTEVSTKFWQGTEIDGLVAGRYWPGDTSLFVIRRARLELLQEVWEPLVDSMSVRFVEDDYFFEDFNLYSGRHRAYINGQLSTSGSEELQFGIENLELATFSEIAGRKGRLRGQVDVEAEMTGTAAAPEIAGHFLLRNAKIEDFKLNYWAGKFGYVKENVSWDFVLAQDSARVFTGAGFLPLRFTLNDSPVVVYDDRPVRIQAATTGLDLALLQTFTQQLAGVEGTLDFDVRLENTLAQPQPQGVVRVHDGAFSLPEYGTRYHDFRFVLAINPGLIQLTSLNLLSEGGDLSAQGKILLDRGEMISIEDGKVRANNFALANNSEMDLKVDADVTLSGAAEALNYRGTVTVNRSQFFVNELMSRSAILQLAPDSVRAASRRSGSTWQYDTRVNGNLTIDLARSTRLVGPDFNFEIGGRLQFVQENDDYSIFGGIQILRGSYQILSKRLEVQSGQINMQGDLETSPLIDVTARYNFRQRGQGGSGRRTLYVKITGEMHNPTINFYLDNLDTPIEEKDALSYLLFNAPAEEIGFALSQQTSAAASLAVGGLLSSQLASSLGEALKLDVIEFYGGQQLAESSVLVGKYLTSDPFDIFISYTQDFSSMESLNGSKVALELELNRPVWFPFTNKKVAIPIIIQAVKGGENDRETGFDLIWKLEW